MCGVMLADGRWAYVPDGAARTLGEGVGREAAGASAGEHPDDRGRVALLIAHDARDETLLLQK